MAGKGFPRWRCEAVCQVVLGGDVTALWKGCEVARWCRVVYWILGYLLDTVWGEGKLAGGDQKRAPLPGLCHADIGLV